jgi:4-amino-4-deoxy-L-arabinose transferase-like glycosyltransferase
MTDAGARGVSPGRTLLNDVTAALLAPISDQFESTAPRARETAIHRLLLLLVLGVGSVLCFYGLGDPGLHGDEETMAMAVQHILQDGRPILPSGMFYPRGLTELYLMALSASVFGMTEWALRLPSALCGVALIALAYSAGKRFLKPQWNLAFAATVGMLPDVIYYSQTARMYIFMLACIAAFLVCLFAWERSGRLRWLIFATASLIIGLDLHALSVTVVLLCLLPGLLQADRRKLVQGILAACVVMVAYVLIDAWVNAQYPVPPPEYAADLPAPGFRDRVAQHYAPGLQVALLVTGALAAVFAVHFGRKLRRRVPSLMTMGWMLAALVAQLLLYYHLAVLFAVAGFVTAYRAGGPSVWRRFGILTLAYGIVALIQLTSLAARPGSIIALIGAIVGQPSIWPYARIAEFSMVAAVLGAAGTAYGLWRIANRQRAPDYALLALLGVWIPLFVLGLFAWNMPSRYTSASLLPLVLCGFAFAQRAFEWAAPLLPSRLPAAALRGTAALVLAVLAINPPELIRVVTAGVQGHPDHKGAALFVRSLPRRPDDIVLAEDVLEQTFYLGHVDYWLIGRKHARQYVQFIDGQVRDFYTGTPVIDDDVQLLALLERAHGRRILIIGSGENQSDRRRDQRGPGIARILNSDLVETLYVGRDGLTKVWRARPVAPGSTDTSHSQSAPTVRRDDTPADHGVRRQS